jgi:AAHS family 4-hydroxybenzoate transporter-like MFS transporter
MHDSMTPPPSGWTRSALRIVALCIAINMVDGMNIIVMSFLQSAIAKDWQIKPERMGFVFSIGLLGMAVGGILIAPLADRYGRRPLILAALGLMTLGSFASGFAPGFAALLIARLIVGLGIGTALATMAALTAEVAPERYRSVAVAVVQGGYPLAAAFIGLIVVQTLPAIGWHNVLFGAAFMTTLVLPVAYVVLPRSPPAMAVGGATKPSSLIILHETYRTRTLFLWMATATGFMVLYFITSWIPKLSVRAGLSEANGIYAGSLYNLGAFIGTTAMGFLLLRVQLTRLLPLLMTLTAISLLVFGGITMPLALTMMVAFLIGVVLQGGTNGNYPLAASIYPSEIRATGIGWAIGVGRIGAVIGPWLGGVLLSAKWPLLGIFAVYAGAALLSAGSIALVAMSIGRAGDARTG